MNCSPTVISLFHTAIDNKDASMLAQLCRQFGMINTLRSNIWRILLKVKPIKLPNPLHLTVVEADVPPLVNNLISCINQTKRTELIKDSYTIATSLVQPKTSPNFIPTVVIALVFYYLYPEESVEFRLGAVFSFLNTLQPYFSHLYPSIQKGLYCLMHILLQYHDPQLCYCLDSFRVESVFYTPRFLYGALFPTGETIGDILILWDEFILNPNKHIFYFAVIAYLMQIRDDIMKETKKNELITLIKTKRITSEQIRIVICRANALEQDTLTSFKLLLHSCFYNEVMFQRWYSQSLGSTLALPVEPTSLLADIKGGMDVLFIDCRTQEMFRGGNIGNAIHFDTTRREDENYVKSFFEQKLIQNVMEHKKNIHVVIYGSGEVGKNTQQTPTLSELTMIMLDFIKRGMKHLGVLLSGYFLYHKNAMAKVNGFEIFNHTPNLCPVCTPPELAKLQTKLTSLGESTKRFATDFFYGLSTRHPNPNSSKKSVNPPQPVEKRTFTPIRNEPNKTEKGNGNGNDSEEKVLKQQMKCEPNKTGLRSSQRIGSQTQLQQNQIPNLLDLGLETITDPSSNAQSQSASLNTSDNLPIKPLSQEKMPIKPLTLSDTDGDNEHKLKLTFDEEYNEDDEDNEHANYFDELMKESPTFEADYNVASSESVDCWKHCLIIMSSVDMLITEKPSGDGEMFLLEEITYTDIDKVSTRVQAADVFIIEVTGKRVVVKVAHSKEFLDLLNTKMALDN
ncbi:hypothetical protein EIN_176880 [Entamoeba invadens IP1]|uniref:hypothetical protein n=1 Tax=Entamoeba invadens IP1 TaxID=370355 RepID=UPI0002C3EFC9|nr:hypothetical protein EIN_176880 [Entamoeba invadens IP1]ELP93861.1 hypothetical protein EIN_176880 [Entamoeba invadens IP1]|eukprot:XP_004260632.1 hypothetical protein EIN_176880 [Entamoeba invadens IP1]